jgi:molybdopterin molybdotransferase
MMVSPFIRRLQGATDSYPLPIRLRAAFDWLRPDARREFLRVQRQGDGLVLFPNQGSAVLSSVVWAHGLVDNPPGQVIRAGDTVDFLPFDAWGAT